MWRAATSKRDMSQQMAKHGNTFCRVRCLLSKHLASTPIMPPKIPCPPYLLIRTDAIKLVRCKSTIIWLGKYSLIEGMNTRRKLNNPDWRMKQEHYIRAEALWTRESMDSTPPSNNTYSVLHMKLNFPQQWMESVYSALNQVIKVWVYFPTQALI
jgi:hypothetical protein